VAPLLSPLRLFGVTDYVVILHNECGVRGTKRCVRVPFVSVAELLPWQEKGLDMRSPSEKGVHGVLLTALSRLRVLSFCLDECLISVVVLLKEQLHCGATTYALKAGAYAGFSCSTIICGHNVVAILVVVLIN
jgi:hypothetical protein